MKHHLLVSLGLALLATALTAQSSLPYGLRAHAPKLPAQVQRTLVRGGFGDPTTVTVVPAPLAKTGVNDPRLDSTVTYFAYAAEGADSLPSYKEIHTYPAPGEERIMSLQHDGTQWVPESRTAITEDAAGRIRLVIADSYDPQTGGWTPDSRIEAFPHGDSGESLDSFFLYQYIPELQRFEQVLANRSYYDEQDRLTDDYSTLTFNGEPLTFHNEYSYNQFDQINYVRTYLVIPEIGEEFLAGEEDRYHENDVLLRVTSYVVDEEGNLLPTEQETYSYDDFNRTATLANFEYDGENEAWLLLDSTYYGYDAQLRLELEETRTFTEDELTSITRLRTGYLQEELVSVITISNYDFVNESFFIDGRTFYFYGFPASVGQPEPAVRGLLAYPNPTAGSVRLAIDRVTLAQAFDLTGRLVYQTTNLGNGQLLDLSTLPKGVYALRVIAGSTTYLGRVVKN